MSETLEQLAQQHEMAANKVAALEQELAALTAQYWMLREKLAKNEERAQQIENNSWGGGLSGELPKARAKLLQIEKTINALHGPTVTVKYKYSGEDTVLHLVKLTPKRIYAAHVGESDTNEAVFSREDGHHISGAMWGHQIPAEELARIEAEHGGKK